MSLKKLRENKKSNLLNSKVVWEPQISPDRGLFQPHMTNMTWLHMREAHGLQIPLALEISQGKPLSGQSLLRPGKTVLMFGEEHGVPRLSIPHLTP
jgi:hypothetical protein